MPFFGDYMKSLLLSAILIFSFSSFATSIEEAVKKIEFEKNAKCTYISTSNFSTCLGTPETCFYSVKYKCESQEGFFGLKLKVRTNLNGTVVRGTVITTK